MTTIIIKDESDGEMIKRISQEDDLDTWMSLTEVFLTMLGGLGYTLPSTPEHMREILEDFHDKTMAVKYPREQEKTENTSTEMEILRKELGKIPYGTQITLSFYNGNTITCKALKLSNDRLQVDITGLISLCDIKSWSLSEKQENTHAHVLWMQRGLKNLPVGTAVEFVFFDGSHELYDVIELDGSKLRTREGIMVNLYKVKSWKRLWK